MITAVRNAGIHGRMIKGYMSARSVVHQILIMNTMSQSKEDAMKIVGKSNFDNEMVDDILIAENVNPDYADGMVDYMNETFCTEHSTYCFFLKEDEYKLYKFEP
jgi:hypothetical protein